jgi:osmotically-inducible protein OsmY
MNRKAWGVVVPIVCLLLGAWTTAAQEPKSTTDVLKEKASSAVKAVKKGVASAEEAIKEKYAQARLTVHNMAVEHRVYARLHWDKALNGSKFDVSVSEGGVATLTGAVADAKAKAKAAELASDTVGVTQVVDQLTVSASAAPAAKKP